MGTVSVEIAASEAADGTAVAAAEDIAVAGDGETGIFAPLEADDAEGCGGCRGRGSSRLSCRLT